jgi:hypothetical protein
MHSAKRYLVIALSFATCMAVFAAFAPRVAHALTATLVQVVNTAASAVPVQDLNRDPRQAIQLRADVFIGDGTPDICRNFFTEDGNDFIVPAGKRLVIQSVSTQAFVPPGQRWVGSSFETSGSNGNFGIHYPPPLVSMGSAVVDQLQFDDYQAAASYTAYSDAGKPIKFCATRNASTGFAGYSITIAGYLLDCGSAGCSVYSQP